MQQREDPALLQWCKQVTADFNHVSVQDFTVSWKSGLAFCAIIARFRPDLINFDILDSKDGKSNCELAFKVAEKYLGIPTVLDSLDIFEKDEIDSRYKTSIVHKQTLPFCFFQVDYKIPRTILSQVL